MDLNIDLNHKSENSNIVPYISKLRIIAQEVVEKHKLIDESDLAGINRPGYIIAARNEFFYRACTETKITLGQIGRFTEQDHTSVHYGAARYALHHDLPPPKGYWPAKVKRTKKSTYPKASRPINRDELDPRYLEDMRSIVAARKRAKRGSTNLLILLKRHHGPLVG